MSSKNNPIKNKKDPVMKKLSEHDKLFKKIDKRFEQVDKRFEVVIKKLLEHDARLKVLEENMFSKEDQAKLFDILDRMSGKLDRLEQEANFSTEWLKRLQADVEKHDIIISKQQDEIYQIKAKIGI